jgi:hypothetical protein
MQVEEKPRLLKVKATRLENSMFPLEEHAFVQGNMDVIQLTGS